MALARRIPHRPRELHHFLLRESRLETPPAPGLIHPRRTHHNQVFRFHQSLRMLRRIPTSHADRECLRNRLRHAQQILHRRKGSTHEVGIQPGDDHLLTGIRQLLGDIHQFQVEEVRLVDAHHLRAPIHLRQDLRRARHRLTLHPLVAMRDNVIVGITIVNGWLKYLHSSSCDQRATQPPDQLFALAGKHGPADAFDPTHVTGDNIHEYVSVHRMKAPTARRVQ